MTASIEGSQPGKPTYLSTASQLVQRAETWV